MPKFCLTLFFVSFILLQVAKITVALTSYNVAKNVTRMQSGEDGSDGADGDSSSTVDVGGGQWWEVDLCSESDCSMPFVNEIAVTANLDGSYFVSMVDSSGREVIRLHHKGAPIINTFHRDYTASYWFTSPIQAKTARLTGDKNFRLAEFEAIGWASVNEFVEDKKKLLPNVAVGQPVYQSSTYGAYYAKLAVDGNTDGSVQAASYSATLGGYENWWEISFTVPVFPEFVVVYNNDHPSYKNYLKEFTVQFFKEMGELVNEISVKSPTVESSYLVSLPKVGGKAPRILTIRINMPSTAVSYLYLAEVEVYGTVQSIEF